MERLPTIRRVGLGQVPDDNLILKSMKPVKKEGLRDKCSQPLVTMLVLASPPHF